MMIDYKLLEALAGVIEEEGFEKAAQRLHITQSAVSQRVKTLEEATGQILVTRTLPPLATEAGHRLLAHYRKVRLLEEDLAQTATGAEPVSLALAINADSLATWFFDVIDSLAREQNLTFELHVDDQEQTQKLLQNGQVCGCISTHRKQLQGCRVEELASMEYGLFATPSFARQWFANGFGMGKTEGAPTILFNRQDNLNKIFFRQFFHADPPPGPTFYVPSSEKIVDCIRRGLCYGPLPILQSKPLCLEGRLIDLMPGCKIAVELYYHCWSLKSKTLESFTRRFVARTRQMLLASRS